MFSLFEPMIVCLGRVHERFLVATGHAHPLVHHKIGHLVKRLEYLSLQLIPLMSFQEHLERVPSRFRRLHLRRTADHPFERRAPPSGECERGRLDRWGLAALTALPSRDGVSLGRAQSPVVGRSAVYRDAYRPHVIYEHYLSLAAPHRVPGCLAHVACSVGECSLGRELRCAEFSSGAVFEWCGVRVVRSCRVVRC